MAARHRGRRTPLPDQVILPSEPARAVEAPRRSKLVGIFDDRERAQTLLTVLEELVVPPPEAVTLFEEGATAWRLEAYFAHLVDLGEVTRILEELTGWQLPDLAIEHVPALNWVAISQAALPPVRAGRFIVHGSHDRGRVPRGPNAILIDAGEAFGTAHHATTEGCLVAIDRLTRRRRFRRVLDLGCGSGVLAIAARRAMPAATTRIIATDIDPEAVRVARENAGANGVGRRLEVIVASGVKHAKLRGPHKFDLVIANILAGPLIMMAKEISRIVAPKGVLVLSGLLVHQAPEVTAAYVAADFLLASCTRRNGWATLVLIRRRTSVTRRRAAGGAKARHAA